MLELAVDIKLRTSKCGQGSQIEGYTSDRPSDGDVLSETAQHVEVSHEDVMEGW